METNMTNQPKKGEFFELLPDGRRGGKGHGVIFENEQALLTPPRLILQPDEGGFPPLRETPLLIYNPMEGALPQDLEGGFSGYWLVSERLRKVMESVDADAFAFADADYRLADGSKGPTVFLCDVVRTLDALDEEASELDIKISDDYEAGKYYSLAGGSRLAFKSGAPEMRMYSSFRLTMASFVIGYSRRRLRLPELALMVIPTGYGSTTS